MHLFVAKTACWSADACSLSVVQSCLREWATYQALHFLVPSGTKIPLHAREWMEVLCVLLRVATAQFSQGSLHCQTKRCRGLDLGHCEATRWKELGSLSHHLVESCSGEGCLLRNISVLFIIGKEKKVLC